MCERDAAVTAGLSALVGAMRHRGVRVGVGELIGAHRALGAVDAASRDEAYHALRAVLCARRADLEAFDLAFEETFGSGRVTRPADAPALPGEFRLALPRVSLPPEPGQAALTAPPGEAPVPAAWSQVEILRGKDFADMSEDERALARRLVRRIALHGPLRRSRRAHPARRRGGHPPGARPDLRATVRASLRFGGEPVERHWREHVAKRRPVVLVCDVSGSMDPYARMLMHYMQAWIVAGRRVEAFAFGTRLTRVTRELAHRDPDTAVARASAALVDASGGTRIGDSLADLNRRHGRRVGRGSVVVVLSDGWDRGDPERLADEMARLGRCAHALIWLNPLKAQPGYEPLARGMQAALPHVDRFLAGDSIASLEQLAELLEVGLG
jgi:hypothetical protein